VAFKAILSETNLEQELLTAIIKQQGLQLIVDFYVSAGRFCSM